MVAAFFTSRPCFSGPLSSWSLSSSLALATAVCLPTMTTQIAPAHAAYAEHTNHTNDTQAQARSTKVPVIHHDLQVSLDVDVHQIVVKDTLSIPEDWLSSQKYVMPLVLHAGLSPQVVGEGAKLVRKDVDKNADTTKSAPKSVAGSSNSSSSIEVPHEEYDLVVDEQYHAQNKQKNQQKNIQVTLTYRGQLDHPIQTGKEEYQRSFSETPGTIGKDGVYLAASSLWIPRVGYELFTFTMDVDGLPDGWTALGEGSLPTTQKIKGKKAGKNHIRWMHDKPSDEIHLLAGPWQVFQKTVQTDPKKRAVQLVAYLRTQNTDNASLAATYLDTAQQYLLMYRDLLGEYPYEKFALVENFWETGYGMPSFTLLGPKIIRFPFILHSSYPHELLHNWWGNGVFFSGNGGNWCEGLTAYLADHLVQEQNGRGAAYRQNTLAGFRDFVTPENDFPLILFQGRTSAASESIGYGKWLMILHMLRKDIGDDAFIKGLRIFYQKNIFTRATFADLSQAMQEAINSTPNTGANEATQVLGQITAGSVDAFLTTWIHRTGAPEIALGSVAVRFDRQNKKYSVEVAVTQNQPEDPFPMRVPVVVTFADGTTQNISATFIGRRDERTAWTKLIDQSKEPVRVDVDPNFDTFRRLLPKEIAPTLSQSLGAQKYYFVVPSLYASDEEQQEWRKFAASLCGPAGADDDTAQKKQCTIVTDEEAGTLPDDASVWVLGYGNLLRSAAIGGAKHMGGKFDDRMFVIDDSAIRSGKNQNTDAKSQENVVENYQSSLMLAFDHPRRSDGKMGLVFVAADNSDAIKGLARKLPHYGKYGYLAFSGTEPTNTKKGTWPAIGSPLVWQKPYNKTTPKIKPAAALAELPPAFDTARMKNTVETLASPTFAGRGNGTAGLDQAVDWVANTLKTAGLSSSKQCFTVNIKNKDNNKDKNICNLVVKIAGRNPQAEALVLSAHLDHLGMEGKEKIYLGADDNASGVAVLIEAARELSRRGPFMRDIYVVFFAGEEIGLQGSSYFVENWAKEHKNNIYANINLDTVGRSQGKPMLIFGGETATEWVHIFQGIGYSTGVKSTLAPAQAQASDQVSFHKAGVPAVQLFSGPNGDYHRHSDSADKVEEKSLLDAVTLTVESSTYLANRADPLHVTINAGGAATTNGANPTDVAGNTAGNTAKTRRAAVGIVPAYDFAGPGVKIDAVTPNSPAEKAGIPAGSVLVEFAGVAVNTLKEYSEALSSKQPNDVVTLKIKVGDEIKTIQVTLGER